ncbi:MAG: DMT family transporter [Candidatus Thorarchaeota archaeon]
MEKNTKKGLLFGIIGIVFVGLQPIVAISRPSIVDPYLAAVMTCFVEATIFLPLMLIEWKKIKKKDNEVIGNNPGILKGWRNNIWLLFFIGLIFGVNQIFFFVGYHMAGAINGSLTQKTTVFFSMFLGYIILKEKITKLQIIFSIVLFFGLAIGITQFFSLIEISLTILIGVGILLAISFLWMVGHTLTKPIFDRKEATPIQMVFLRNFLSGLFLILTYFIFFPINFGIWFEPGNVIFFIAMGATYGAGLVCWYKTLSYLDISKATIMFAPTPITSAIFAAIILGEKFTVFNLLGIIFVVISIVVIVNQKKE